MDPATAKRCLSALCYAFGHEINNDRLNALYTVLRTSGCTVAEMELATALIPTRDALCKRVSYDRAVGPGVFTMARLCPEVMAGRLHTHSEAAEMCTKANRTLTSMFEAVYVEGDDVPRWRML